MNKRSQHILVLFLVALVSYPRMARADESRSVFGELNVRNLFQSTEQAGPPAANVPVQEFDAPKQEAVPIAKQTSNERPQRINKEEYAKQVIERLKNSRAMLEGYPNLRVLAEDVESASGNKAPHFAKEKTAKPSTKIVESGPTTISLVVNALPVDGALRHLKALDYLAKNRGVKVGGVMLVGIEDLYRGWKESFGKEGGAYGAKRRRGRRNRTFDWRGSIPGTLTALERMNLVASDTISFADFQAKTGVRFSPVWIVRHQGKDYLYEGLERPAELFSHDGTFLGPQSGGYAL